MRASLFDGWMNAWSLGRSARRFAETIEAASQVVDSRCRTMAAAASDPVHGDYRELGRMLPEKVDAFGRAGASAWTDLFAFQADAVANWLQAADILMAGRAPRVDESRTMWSRSTRMTKRALGAGDRAFAPIHHRAVANARRLRRPS